MAGASAVGAAVTVLHTESAAPAEAVPPEGFVTFAWFWGEDQSIPSGGWHDLVWPNPPALDNDDYYDPAKPANINLVQGGLYNLVVEVAWPVDSTGYRGLRVVQGGFVIAQAPFMKGASLGEGFPNDEHQHQQVVVQPGTSTACKAQVLQSSGADLVCARTLIGSPSMMIARLGSF